MGVSFNLAWCVRRGDKQKHVREVGHGILSHNGLNGDLEECKQLYNDARCDTHQVMPGGRLWSVLNSSQVLKTILFPIFT